MKIQIKKRLFQQPILEVEFDPIELPREETKITYLLLKDLPFLKAGTLITYHEDQHGMITTQPLKLLLEYEGHYLDWFMKEVYENPSGFKDFIKLIR